MNLSFTNRERAVWNSHTSPSEKIAFVRRLTLFSDVDPSTCATIISDACEKRLWRRQTIFSADDPIQQVMMLLSGCVKITQLGLNGNEVILRLSGVGEMVGDLQPSENHTHSSTAQTVQDAVALVWDVANFAKLLDRFPAFRRNTVRALEGRLHEMEQRFREVSTLSVGPRLSSELIRRSTEFQRQTDVQESPECTICPGTVYSAAFSPASRTRRLQFVWGFSPQRRDAFSVRIQSRTPHFAMGGIARRVFVYTRCSFLTPVAAIQSPAERRPCT